MDWSVDYRNHTEYGGTVQTKKKFYWSSSFVENHTLDQPQSNAYRVLSGYFTKRNTEGKKICRGYPGYTAEDQKVAGCYA